MTVFHKWQTSLSSGSPQPPQGSAQRLQTSLMSFWQDIEGKWSLSLFLHKWCPRYDNQIFDLFPGEMAVDTDTFNQQKCHVSQRWFLENRWAWRDLRNSQVWLWCVEGLLLARAKEDKASDSQHAHTFPLRELSKALLLSTFKPHRSPILASLCEREQWLSGNSVSLLLRVLGFIVTATMSMLSCTAADCR